jgi:hypothetical protein
MIAPRLGRCRLPLASTGPVLGAMLEAAAPSAPAARSQALEETV